VLYVVESTNQSINQSFINGAIIQAMQH